MSNFHHVFPSPYYLSEADRTDDLKSCDSHAERSSVLSPDGASLAKDAPDTKGKTYQAPQSAQDAKNKLHLMDVTTDNKHTHSESVSITKPLLIECDDCNGAGSITHGHANNPYAPVWTCSMCDGAGEVIPGCECCREDAVAVFEGACVCAVHAAELVEDTLGAMTSWGRAIVRSRMRRWLTLTSGSLEMAETGKQLEADGLAGWFRLPHDTMVRVAMANEP